MTSRAKTTNPAEPERPIRLLADLKTWNDSWDFTIIKENEEDVPDEVLYERGRELAIRVQDELGTDGWEVLYFQDGQAHRVHPPGSWPDGTWQQDLLGYPRRRPRWAPSAE